MDDVLQVEHETNKIDTQMDVETNRPSYFHACFCAISVSPGVVSVWCFRNNAFFTLVQVITLIHIGSILLLFGECWFSQ